MEFESSFPLSLRRITIVRIGALLLEEPLLGSKIRSYFLRQMYDVYEERDLFAMHFDSSINVALEACCNHLQLPSDLISELTVAIKSMALKMYHWYVHIYSKYDGYPEKTISCMRKICWTHYGSIDYRKTFEFCWLGNSDITKRDVFRMACDYAFEDHIRAHWEPISTSFPAFSISNLAIYWQYVFCDNLDALENVLNLAMWNRQFLPLNYPRWHAGHRIERIPSKIFMLVLATYQGHCEAAKYFWCTLDEKQKSTYFLPWAGSLMFSCNIWNREQYADICAYMWEQITYRDYVNLHKVFVDEEKHDIDCYLLVDRVIGSTLSYFRSLWPWRDKFNDIVQKVLRFPELWECYDNFSLTGLVEYILYTYDDFGSLISPARRVTLFCTMWRAMTKAMKLLCSSQWYACFFTKLLNGKKDVLIIKLIVNDEMMISMRSELIEKCARKLLREANGNFQLMNEFLNLISSSEEEKKSAMQQLYVCDYLVKDIQTEDMENFFRWQYKTHEEYSLFRAKLNVMEYWRRIMQKHMFEYANTFLQWYFDSSKLDIAEFKKILLNTTYPCDIIIKYWCPGDLFVDIVKSVRQSKQFLYWLLEHDEAVAEFIRKVLVHQSYKIPADNTTVMCRRSQFLKWCSQDVRSYLFKEFNDSMYIGFIKYGY